MSNIVVVAEVRAGKLKRPSLEAVAAGLQLATQSGGKVTHAANCYARIPPGAPTLQVASPVAVL